MNLPAPFRGWLLAPLLALALLSNVRAADESQPFIDGRDLPLFHYLAPPPANDAAQTRAEVAELLAIQATRTPAMVESAAADVIQDVWRFRSALPVELQARFNAESLPSLHPLFDRLRATKSAVVNATKEYWQRPRPYVLSADVKPGIRTEPTASYPSGHSTVATLMAVVLADMLPEYRAAIFERAAAYAENRVVGGVHYRSDIVAGRTSGALIALALQRDDAFLAQYRPAREELRRVLALP